MTDSSLSGMNLTLHANNTQNSNAAGGIAKDGATIVLSDSITSFTVNLDGDVLMGESTHAEFVKLDGSKLTVDPTVKAGTKAIIGTKNVDGTYRTMTFVNSGDGTYTIRAYDRGQIPTGTNQSPQAVACGGSFIILLLLTFSMGCAIIFDIESRFTCTNHDSWRMLQCEG